MKKKVHLSAIGAALLLAFTLGMSAPVQDQIGEGSPAPDFEITADNGETYTIDSLTEDAPAFILFWKERCPHNARSADLFNDLASAYQGKVNFVGVVTAPHERIKDWAEQFGTTYPLLPDGESMVIDSWQLTRSIVTYQIDTDGKIAKIFGGYGYDALAALNEAMAAAAGVDAAEVDLSSAPTRTTYG